MADSAYAPVDFSSWTCPAPLRDHDRVVMGHGGGGTLSAELVEHLFAPAFALRRVDGQELEAHERSTSPSGS